MPFFAAFFEWLATELLIAVGATSASVGTLATVTWTLQTVAVIGLSMATSRLLAPKMPTMSDLSGREEMTRNPVAARQIIYGQCKVSGPVVFLATSGAKNQFLHIVIAVAGHQVEEIGDVYFNEDLVLSGAGDGYGSGIFSNCLIHKKLGTTTQTVDTTLEADFPTDWDSSHRLRGIAYLYAKLTYSADVFPGGIPNISCIVKGKLCYNPTGGATAYTANPALCLRDYLTDTDLGLGMTSSEMDDTAVAAAATICDEAVAHLPSGTETRYACHGIILTSSTPDRIIGQLLSSMAGTLAYSGGKVVVLAGAYRTPTITLDETHLAGGISVQTRLSARDRINGVKGTYVSAANQWQPSDFPSVKSPTYVTEDNAVEHWRDVVLSFTTSSNAAQRIALIQLRQAREEITFSAHFNLHAMRLRAGDTVMITNTKLGWTAKVFAVVEWAFATAGTPPQPVIAMTLRETASTVYAWDVADEVAVASAPNTDLPDPFAVPTPSITLLTDTTTVTLQPDGTVQPRLKVSWTTPNDIHVESGGVAEIEYKKTTDSDYTVWASVRGNALFDYINDVKVGVAYDVRVRFTNNLGVSGAYDTDTSAAVVGDTVPPNAVTGISCTPFPNFIELLWPPSTSNTVNEYKIYRSIVSAVAGFVLRAETANTAFADTNVTEGQQYWYYIVAISASEIPSADSAVVTTIAVNPAVTDPDAPATPAAFNLNAATQVAYLAADGTSLSRFLVDLPAMPSGGAWMELLYKRSDQTLYMVAGTHTAGSVAAPIDDCTPGQTYDIAVRAYSAFGVASALRVITSSPKTAPADLVAPSAPTSITYTSGSASGYARPPVFYNGNMAESLRINWTAPTASDLSHYQYVVSASDTDADADYYVSIGQGVKTNDTEVIYSALIWATGYFRVRAIDFSGNASAWAGGGTNIDSVHGRPAGTMVNQNASAVAITGGTVTGIIDLALADGGTASSTAAGARTNLGLGSIATQATTDVEVSSLQLGAAGASSIRAIIARFADSFINATLTGGSPTEYVTVSLTNRGFTAKPDVGIIECSSDRNIGALYEYTHAANSSTVAYCLLWTRDGTNLPASAYRFNAEFIQYN